MAEVDPMRAYLGLYAETAAAAQQIRDLAMRIRRCAVALLEYPLYFRFEDEVRPAPVATGGRPSLGLIADWPTPATMRRLIDEWHAR